MDRPGVWTLYSPCECFSGWMGLDLGVWKQGPCTVLVSGWMGLGLGHGVHSLVSVLCLPAGCLVGLIQRRAVSEELLAGTAEFPVGGSNRLCLIPHCHHQTDSCIKVGSGESHCNVSFINCEGQSQRQCP